MKYILNFNMPLFFNLGFSEHNGRMQEKTLALRPYEISRELNEQEINCAEIQSAIQQKLLIPKNGTFKLNHKTYDSLNEIDLLEIKKLKLPQSKKKRIKVSKKKVKLEVR